MVSTKHLDQNEAPEFEDIVRYIFHDIMQNLFGFFLFCSIVIIECPSVISTDRPQSGSFSNLPSHTYFISPIYFHTQNRPLKLFHPIVLLTILASILEG